jgi:protein CpxP
MKKILLILLALLTLVSVNAQNNVKSKSNKSESEKKQVTPEARAEKITNRLTTELTLTEDQKPKVKQITLERIKATNEARAKAGDDKNAFKTEKKVIFQKWETNLLSVLNQDQQKTYFVKKEERKQKIKEKKDKKNGQGSDDSKDEQDDEDNESGN